jgi:hypothetical protein
MAGICGEAPANYPKIAQFLVGLGIDSISVNPSSLLRTIKVLRAAEAEQTMPSPKDPAAPRRRRAWRQCRSAARNRPRGRRRCGGHAAELTSAEFGKGGSRPLDPASEWVQGAEPLGLAYFALGLNRRWPSSM